MNNYTHIIGDPSIEAYFRTFLQYAETKGFKLTEFEQTLRGKGLRSQGVWIESGYTHQGTKSGRFSSGYHSSELSLSNLPKEVLPPTQIKP